jgi:class 3 adenylate cyclase
MPARREEHPETNPRVAETEPPDASRSNHSPGDASIKTFLIADVRGYTLFTQTHGDEAAAKLAAGSPVWHGR